jgi:RNA recognition motif-containing protein
MHFSSIFIGNLPFQATEDQVRSHFSQIGPVASVRLLYNKATAQNSGAGYVEFDEK